MATVTIQYIEKSKEELIDELLKKDRLIEQLQEKLKEQEQKLKEKKKPKFVKANLKKKRRKKPGRKKGHLGKTRPNPDHVDQTIALTLDPCPDCGSAFEQPAETVEHIQEDIIPAHVQVTNYIKYRYWCSSCRVMHTAKAHPAEIPNGYLGPNVLIHAALLKYQHHLPYESIAGIFQSFCQLTVTPGALAQAMQRLSGWLGIEKQAIQEALQKSPVKHMDETGWRLDGKSHWVWELVNEKLAYYHIDSSRGSKVAKALLGKNPQGILITDFYSAYTKLPMKKQKCLVHLFREMHRIKETDTSKEYQTYHKKIRRVFEDALRLSLRHGNLDPPVYHRRLEKIKKRLFLLACREYENKNLIRLTKRFLKHWLYLLTFLSEPGLAWHNNLAERLIRPNVINRNRSFGNRSQKGAEAHATLMSIIQTMKLQGKDLVTSLSTLIETHSKSAAPAILV